MKNPYSTLYNIPSILTFSKSVDAQKLADCVVKVIKAHPYIMTHLSLENDDIEQAYVDSAKPNVPVEKLTEEQLEAYKKDFVKPHNLMKAPLFRISVAETEKAVYLLSDFHHLIFDGASVALFFEQLKTLYEGGNIEPESYTYFDYAENEIKAESSDEFRNAEKFFDNMMKNFESASEITADSEVMQRTVLLHLRQSPLIWQGLQTSVHSTESLPPTFSLPAHSTLFQDL